MDQVRRASQTFVFEPYKKLELKGLQICIVGENQDGGVDRHTAPPRTTRTDRKSNGKEVQHQGTKK